MTSRRHQVAVLLGLLTIIVGTTAGVYTLVRSNETTSSDSGSGAAPISVPAPYLYVLDIDAGTMDWSNITADSAVGRIQVLDKESLQVIKSIPTGYDPQMALSADRQFLYLAETVAVDPGRSVASAERLRIFDVSAGWETVDTISLPWRWRTTGAALPAAIVSSDDGRYLYMPNHSAGNAADVDYVVNTYDRQSGAFLTDVQLPKECGPTITAVPGTSSSLVATCQYNAHSIVFADAVSGNTLVIELPDKPPTSLSGVRIVGSQKEVAGTVITADGSDFYVLTRSGAVYKVDVASQSVVDQGQLAIGKGNLVAFDGPFLSSDGSNIYVGLASGAVRNEGLVDRVSIYSLQDLVEVDSVDLSTPLRSFLVSDDELNVVGVGRQDGLLRVYDKQTGSEVATATVSDIEGTPDLIAK